MTKEHQNEGTAKNTFTPKTSVVLRKLLHDRYMRPSRLSETLDIPNQTIHQLLHKEVIYPKISTLLPIAQFFKITVEQLIGLEPLDSSKSIADEAMSATSVCNKELADIVRYELEMVTYVLGRISYHAAQSTICSPSLTWALTYKVKQLTQLLLERKPCLWLDLLNSIKCQIPQPLSQILVQFKIHSIDEIQNLQLLQFIDLVTLFGQLHDNLLVYESDQHHLLITEEYV